MKIANVFDSRHAHNNDIWLQLDVSFTSTFYFINYIYKKCLQKLLHMYAIS